MAQINFEMLDAAFNDGWFDRPIGERQRLYLRQSIITAHDLVILIKASIDGLSAEQLTNRSQLNHQTCLQYCRWLAEKGLITIGEERNHGSSGVRNVYRIKE